MQLSLFDVLIITVVSMGVVFIILVGLMFLMQATSKIVATLTKPAPQPDGIQEGTSSIELTGQALFMQEPAAKVAVLTALAHASQAENKIYKIESVERVR